MKQIIALHWPSAVLSGRQGRKLLASADAAELVEDVVVYRDRAVAEQFDEEGYVETLAGTSIYIVVESDAVCFTVSHDDCEAAQIADHVRVALWQNHSEYEIPQSQRREAA